MAELLIVVVVVVFLLGYAADRARKLRVRARQMSGMNDRLDVAAAKVDKEQQQRRARSMASAELTSVMPAIKRPPLTIPGMAGHGDEPEEPDGEAAPGASAPAGAGAPAETGSPAGAGSSGETGSPAETGSPGETGAAAPGAQDEAGDIREVRATAHLAADAVEAPDTPDAEPRPASADAVPAGEVPAPPAPRLADDTLSMPAGMTADDLPAVSKIQVTTEGTLIMRPVPDQGPVPAGEVMPPPDGAPDDPGPSRKRADRR
jgi:hypothetical protein